MNCSIKAVKNMVDGAQKVKIIILKKVFFRTFCEASEALEI